MSFLTSVRFGVAGLLLAGAAGTPALAQDASEAEPQTYAELSIEDPERLAELSIEELANVEITSVSKRPEPLSTAPSSVYVITNDDIRRSGALSLPEALRLAPNLHVARIDALDYAISARGLNGFESANKLLVLIDGRSVYSALFSGVDWDQQHVMLEDVERIEVISGPGGTLWGANAVNGVINVITRDARETDGLLVSASGGSLDSVANVRYGGSFNGGGWRAYVSGYERGSLEKADGADANDGWDGVQAGFRTDLSLGRDSLTLQGDVRDNSIDQSIGLPGYVRGGNLLARWERRLGEGSALEVQAYYDRVRREARGIYDALDAFDVQAQHAFTWRNRHQIVWGGGWRVAEDDFRNFVNGFVLDPLSKRTSLGNVFVQDKIQLSPALDLTVGVKYEHSSYTGADWLPSARLSWRLSDRSMLWGAVSRSVRTPSRLERDLVFPGIVVNGTFGTEKLVAWEAGWRGRPLENLSLSVSAFFNQYDDLRTNELSPGGVLPIFLGNEAEGETWGIEAWGDWAVTPNWRLGAGFTALEKDFRSNSSLDVSGLEVQGVDPDWHASLRSQHDIGERMELDLRLRAVDDTPVGTAGGYVGADAYAELDVRVGWRLTDRAELSLTGLNLLDERHREASENRGVEIPRSVHASLRWRY